MSTAAVVLAVLLALAALPLILRIDSAWCAGQLGRARIEAGRLVLAAAAVAVLVTLVARSR